MNVVWSVVLVSRGVFFFEVVREFSFFVLLGWGIGFGIEEGNLLVGVVE